MHLDSLSTRRYAMTRYFSRFLFYNGDWRIVRKSNKSQKRDWKVSLTPGPLTERGTEHVRVTCIAFHCCSMLRFDDGCCLGVHTYRQSGIAWISGHEYSSRRNFRDAVCGGSLLRYISADKHVKCQKKIIKISVNVQGNLI